jgi:hypothetical protein
VEIEKEEFEAELPVDTQAFRDIIASGFTYVDKTDLLAALTKRRAVFLSRPRRFGKSLIISTLKELFMGNQDLFTGLKIMDLKAPEFKFVKHPVITLDMAMDCSTPKEFTQELKGTLKDIAKSFGLKTVGATPGRILKNIIIDLSENNTKRVVVLIDEYDYPVSHNLDNLTLAKDNSKILSSFYVNLKKVQENLRFVFVTGVTRYAMMGLSAALNNLFDISLDPEYASICGFTHEELDLYFSKRYPVVLKALKKARSQPSSLDDSNKSFSYMSQSATVHDLQQEILDWYDGYTWDGETKVLNPFSILTFLQKKRFKTFWLDTYGSMDYLANTITRFPFDFTQDKMEGIQSNSLSIGVVGEFKPGPLLFHTGYLTIDSIYYEGKKEIYSLKVPNFETRVDFYKHLNDRLFSLLVIDKNKELECFEDAIATRDDFKLTKIFASLYSSLTANLHMAIKEETVDISNENFVPPAKESFYHSLFLAYCLGMSAETRAEESGSYGDPDLIIKLNDSTYVVMELKYAKDESKKPEEVEKILDQKARVALAAIEKKKYGQRYVHQGQTVVFVGIGVYGRGEVKALFAENSAEHSANEHSANEHSANEHSANYLDVQSSPPKKKVRRGKPVPKRKN